jgi:hypothetical protein
MKDESNMERGWRKDEKETVVTHSASFIHHTSSLALF